MAITTYQSSFTGAALDEYLQLVSDKQTLLNGMTASYTEASAAIVAKALTTDELGVASGVAGLDGTGKLSTSVLPESVLSSLKWQGTWDVGNNSPAIADASDDNLGYFYKVSNGGTSDITGTSLTWYVGDWLISNGESWERVPTSTDVATTTASGIITIAGDIGGTYNDISVEAINGIALPSAAPETGNLLFATSTSETEYRDIEADDLPAATSTAQGAIQLAGDITGTAASPLVTGINGYTLNGDPSSAGDVLAVKDLDGKIIGWDTLTAENLDAFTGASSSAAGAAGVVPAPSSGQQDMQLRGDGTWGYPSYLGVDTTAYYTVTSSSILPNTNNSYTLGSSSYCFYSAYVNQIYASSAGYLGISGSTRFAWNTSAFYPVSSLAYNLGTSSYYFNETYTKYIYGSTYLCLGVDSSVAAVINSSGYLYIGSNSSASYPLQVAGYEAGSDTSFSYLNSSGVTTSSGTYAAKISIYASNHVSASLFLARSDERAKTDIETMDPANALELVKSVRSVSYNWKDGINDDKRHIGWIAQEVGKANIGEAVTFERGTIINDDGEKEEVNDFHTLDNTAMTAILWAAVQSLSSKVETLEAKIAKLEA